MTKDRFNELDFSVTSKIIEEVSKGKVLAPKVMNNVGSLYDEYCICHNSEDLRVLEEVIKEKKDKAYLDAFNKVMHLTHKPHCYNMFLMSWQDFDKYATWLFDILGEVEKRINISNYSSVQQRVFGYMAERLFNVWISAENKTITHKPLMFIMDDDQGSKLFYLLKSFLNDVSFFLSTLYIRVGKN